MDFPRSGHVRIYALLPEGIRLTINLGFPECVSTAIGVQRIASTAKRQDKVLAHLIVNRFVPSF